MSGRLILARHSESELDAQDTFSGMLDPPLSKEGDRYAVALAYCIDGLKVMLDYTFSSPLEACRQTAYTIVHRIGCRKPTIFASELDERDYGPMQGLSRFEAVQRWGEQHVSVLRHGSTRPDDPVRARVAKLYEGEIAPKLKNGAVVLVVSYEDNLDALVALVDPGGEQLPPGAFVTGAALDFRLDANLGLVSRDLIQETRWEQGS